MTAAKKPEKQEIQEKKKPQPNIGGSLFGVKSDNTSPAPANPFSNPFASPTNGKSPANPFASSQAPTLSTPSAPTVEVTSPEPSSTTTLPETFASKLRVTSPPPTSRPPRPHEPWPPSSAFPPAYPTYHLDAEYETLDAPSTPQIPANARMDLDTSSSSAGGGGKEDKEVFESSLDKTFQKFADRVGQNPEQVLRYEFRGKPLLYSDADAVGKALAAHAEYAGSSNVKVTTTGSRGGSGMPRCQNCGADRVFEVQLTPHAITELEVDEMGLEGMEWGSIILGVCERDCQPGDVGEGEVGYLEEWVGVQWEEITSKR
jgi:pre-rRNA-processing protein TSR4